MTCSNSRVLIILTMTSTFVNPLILIAFLLGFTSWNLGGDAGELLAESCQLGTAHPPGYPLFTLISHGLIKLFQNIWTPAKTINIACCFMGTATFVIVCQCTQMLAHSNVSNSQKRLDRLSCCSLLSGFTFALSPIVWEYSIGTEVFAMNNLFISYIIFCTIQLSISNDVSMWSQRGALVCGFALSHQHASCLFIFPLSIHVIMIVWFRCRFWKSFLILSLKLVMWLLLGVSPYLYLVWASQSPKAGSWGDMTNLRGFSRHILREEYGTFHMMDTKQQVEGSLTRWHVYFRHLYSDYSIVGVFLFLIGVISTFVQKGATNAQMIHTTQLQQQQRNHKSNSTFSRHGNFKSDINDDIEQSNRNYPSIKTTLVLTLLFYMIIWNGIFSNLPLNVPMAFEVQSRFWMQPDMIVCLFIGLGGHTCYTFILQKTHENFKALLWSIKLSFIVLLLLAIKQSDILSLKWSRSDIFWMMHDYGTSILETLPPQSLLLSHTDLDWNTVRYLQVCEGIRKHDVTHISLQLMPYPWFQRQSHLYKNVTFPKILDNVSTNRLDMGNALLIRRFVEANMKSFSGGIYLDMQSIKDADIGLAGIYRHGTFMLQPWGLVYRVVPKYRNMQGSSDENNQQLILSVIRDWHPSSRMMIKKVRTTMSKHNLTNDTSKDHHQLKRRRGSWEFAAQSVFWDMHYVLSLHLLTMANTIKSHQMIQNHDLIRLQFYLLHKSCELLWKVLHVVDERNTIRYVKSL